MQSIIVQFIEGQILLGELLANLRIRIRKDEFTRSIEGPVGSSGSITLIRRESVMMFCDLALNGTISAENLSDIAFLMLSDDSLAWDEDEVISTTLFDWSHPKVNYPLNKRTLSAFRKRLESGDLSISIA